MGLDITAHEHVAVVDREIPDDDEALEAAWEEGLIHACVYDSFQRSARGYELEDGPDANGVIYGPWLKPSGETIGFRAGSYSGYGQFRRALCYAALDTEPEQVWE